MSDLVYPIKNIFSLDKREGVLGQKDAVKYYIAPYQRGFKWSSDTPNSAVWLLMTDIIDAFTGEEEEYFLQYITVKENISDDEKVLEIIDGQQRLTTLTLIFSVLSSRLGNKNLAISNHLLSYKVRPIVSTFFNEYIYNGLENLLDKTWGDFMEESPEYDSQDIYYMFKAIDCINKQLPEDKERFYHYLSDHVKIILNDIGKGNVSSEKVFSNLNTNKVDLTSAELVKGLLLTRAARENEDEKINRHFKEILELRATMGRQWDEMANWSEHPDIKSFYFSDFPEPMGGLIHFLGLKYKYKKPGEKSTKYDLFNFFQSLIKREGKKASLLFSELRQIFFQLKDWFNNKEVHNLLGYLFFYKESEFTLENLIPLLKLDKVSLHDNLVSKIKDLIDVKANELAYGETNLDIHKVLLFINVFGSDTPFNFKELTDRKWTLEHIFPQNPDFLPNSIGPKDLELIKKLLRDNWENLLLESLSHHSDESILQNKIGELKTKLTQVTCELTKEDKEILYRAMKEGLLNSIGNMALLSGKDNSSNSNGLFDAKRINIVKLISKGSFVPKHTYDVFSKLLSEKMEPDLSVWSEKDIRAHEAWIKVRIETIKQTL